MRAKATAQGHPLTKFFRKIKTLFVAKLQLKTYFSIQLFSVTLQKRKQLQNDGYDGQK